MIVKNFNKGNFEYRDTSSAVYYGKIIMTYVEFCKAVRYLKRCKLGESYENAGLQRMLSEDLQKKEAFNGGFNVCIRVTATRKLFNKYNLPRYKTQNYYIQVLTK